MRNLFLFIRRFSTLLFFLVLQGLSIALLVNYNKSQQAAYMEMSYEVTGKISKQANEIKSYLTLGENNRRLSEENAQLKNGLPSSFMELDTAGHVVSDTTKYDSTGKTRKYIYRVAKAINNSVAFQNNYITLELGRLQGVERGQAVVSAAGIVGIVTDVSNNMAIVMSLLHHNSRQSVMLRHSLVSGTLTWDGRNPQQLQLGGISKSTKVAKGDTVLSSNLSINFPPGLLVGTIDVVEQEKSGNNYLIQVKPGANFASLQYVHIIQNIYFKEQAELEARPKKQ